MRILEAAKDYPVCLKEEFFDGLGFVSTMIFLSILPFILLILLGFVSWVGFILVGYFVALALVSPRTAEKLVRDAIESKQHEESEEVEEE